VQLSFGALPWTAGARERDEVFAKKDMLVTTVMNVANCYLN
jgi:hypothetical protein